MMADEDEQGTADDSPTEQNNGQILRQTTTAATTTVEANNNDPSAPLAEQTDPTTSETKTEDEVQQYQHEPDGTVASSPNDKTAESKQASSTNKNATAVAADQQRSKISKEEETKEQPQQTQDDTTLVDDFEIIDSLYGPPPSGTAGGGLGITAATASAKPTNNTRRVSALRRGSLLTSSADNVDRKDHLQSLMMKKRASMYYVQAAMDTSSQQQLRAQEQLRSSIAAMSPSMQQVLSPSKIAVLEQDASDLKEAAKLMRQIGQYFPETTDNRVSIRLSNFTYRAPKDPEKEHKIETVYNQSCVYGAWTLVRRLLGLQAKPEKQEQVVLDDLTLTFEAGKMYLILGPPGCGKTSLLKAVAGRLSTVNGEIVEGTVEYNGLTLSDKRDVYVENVISYVGQLDIHAPRLTVKETFDFAFQCKTGGTHVPKQLVVTDEAREFVKKLDKEDALPKNIMEFLGLEHVADTFVGNTEIRGVSGGQRRRVTVGEMVVSPTPVFCGDEISNGLDAESTHSIIESLMYFGQLLQRVRIISLLQPSPETVSLFDDVILLADGQLLYAGPVDAVEDYFGELGYRAPDSMDVADFLQVLSTPEGEELFDTNEGGRDTPYTLAELAETFKESKHNQQIIDSQKEPWKSTWELHRKDTPDMSPTAVKLRNEYANSSYRATWLNLYRNLVIWSRDKRFLIANGVKNVIMGVSVGGVFYQTQSVVSIFGVLFQLNLFIMLGAMTSAPALVDDRIIFYRHFDANFYGAFSYALGKAVALLPQSLCDVLIFGTICYFMVGLTTAVKNFFVYIAILFVFSFVMNQQLAISTAIAENKSGVQAASSVVLLFFVVFCGFLVLPSVIPNYYIWIYWWNPLAWTYRSLLVNEFTSPDYDEIYPASGESVGDVILSSAGLVYNGSVVGREWIAYSFAYMVPYGFLCTLVQGACLRFIRVEPPPSPSPLESETNEDGNEAADVVEVPFKPVTLTFTDICYDVKASTGKETIRLLNNVNGIFTAGRMCALMGSSGAGKTTLMDVIALRKTTGTIQGDVRLNGYEQERISFRRCSGYVEQFDVQAAELTVRETVLFSARLRLNSEDPDLAGDDIKQKYTDQVLATLELTSLSDCIVGRDGEGGLSFEQRKRLSIAVELAASPSIIFLDEPTSGLDARAALLVVKALRKIADQGRTVIATIHQPSSSVFDLFDDLLLLRKGGRTVFFGELGSESCNLVKYFEARGAAPLHRGENPANWMLTVITSDHENVDYVAEFLESPQYQTMQANIQRTIEVDGADPNNQIVFATQFAAPFRDRRKLLIRRVRRIYWRSPAYNLLRMIISIVIAFVLGSIFITNRLAVSEIITEDEMSGVLSIIFIAFIIIGVLSMNSVLPVMLELRDNFYRHRSSGMYGHSSLALALGIAEMPFIVISSFMFCVIFMPCVGLGRSVLRSIAFWGFFTFNISIYSYFGQAFVACVPTVPTAQILAAVFIGINNFFSGLIVRPQYINGFFAIPFWITPGHYVYEGLVLASFSNDQRQVLATTGTDFYAAVCGDDYPADRPCLGTIDDYIKVFFGGQFQSDHLWYDILALAIFLVGARLSTFLALKFFNYTGA